MRCHCKVIVYLVLALVAIVWGLSFLRTYTNFRQHIRTNGIVNQKLETAVNSNNANIKTKFRSSNKSAEDFCVSNPCQNEGTCTNSQKRYICFCKNDYIGRNCQQRNDEKHQKREELWIAAVKNSMEKEKRKRRPDVIGIGVEKCGTDALISFLHHHPLVKIPKFETQFFNKRYKEGLDYYIKLMPKVSDDDIIMEKTPSYFNFLPTDIPFRIKKDVPDAKILLVLCDPVNRTYSDYVQEKIIGGIWDKTVYDELVRSYLGKYGFSLTNNLHRPDSEAFSYITEIHKSDAPSHIFTTGLYYYHLLRWRELFNPDHLYIINGEDLISQPGIEIEKLQKFLNLPQMLLKEDFVRNEETGFFCFEPKWSSRMQIEISRNHHTYCLSKSKGRTRNKKKDASEWSLNSLRTFYKPFNEKLFKLLEKKMSWY